MPELCLGSVVCVFPFLCHFLSSSIDYFKVPYRSAPWFMCVWVFWFVFFFVIENGKQNVTCFVFLLQLLPSYLPTPANSPRPHPLQSLMWRQ